MLNKVQHGASLDFRLFTSPSYMDSSNLRNQMITVAVLAKLILLGLLRLLSFLGCLGVSGPSKIGSQWSSFHTATGQVAFHGINLLSLLG